MNPPKSPEDASTHDHRALAVPAEISYVIDDTGEATPIDPRVAPKATGFP